MIGMKDRATTANAMLLFHFRILSRFSRYCCRKMARYRGLPDITLK